MPTPRAGGSTARLLTRYVVLLLLIALAAVGLGLWSA
jgi:hypothetical protein